VAAAQCHELSGYLVSGTPLSSWWIATSIWSVATFVTWIGEPPSQIGILSISNLKDKLPNNRYPPLRLSVRSLLCIEASWADLKWLHSAPTSLVSPNPSAIRDEHEMDRTSRTLGKRQILMYLVNWHLQFVRFFARGTFWSSRHSTITACGSGSNGAWSYR
jgi:hypothetical protein